MEPVLLGLIVAWSGAGVAVGVAAFAAFLLRTPAKLVAIDIRRDRWLARSRLALRIATIEALVLAVAVTAAIVLAGWWPRRCSRSSCRSTFVAAAGG